MKRAEQQAVLVTGASSGIGRACVTLLAKQGFHVYASVRRQEDVDSLCQQFTEASVFPVILDVTDEAAIASTVDWITEHRKGKGLDGLVNNAGVAFGGPLELLPLNAVRSQMEINVLGQLAVTQACLPLLRGARGRIVNMGSIAGKRALPFMGPYSASKHALEALTDALRIELKPWGIHVAIVEPGSISTPLWQKSLQLAETLLKPQLPHVEQLYGSVLEKMVQAVKNSERRGIDPHCVAQVVLHALTVKAPKTRYLVGRDAHIRSLLQFLPDDFNDWLIMERLGVRPNIHVR